MYKNKYGYPEKESELEKGINEIKGKVPRCCDKAKDVQLDYNLLHRLYMLSRVVSVPLSFTSGVRCADCNKKVGGKVNSQHLYGRAVDIQVNDCYERMSILRGVLQVGFTRVGIGAGFIHVDVKDYLNPEYICWLY